MDAALFSASLIPSTGRQTMSKHGHCCNHTDEKEKAGMCCRAAKSSFEGEKKTEAPAAEPAKEEKPAHKSGGCCSHKPS